MPVPSFTFGGSRKTTPPPAAAQSKKASTAPSKPTSMAPSKTPSMAPSKPTSMAPSKTPSMAQSKTVSSHHSDVESATPVIKAPFQQAMAGARTPPLESGFPDPYKLLADSRRVVVTKELSHQAKMVNCVFGFCGVTRYRYYVRDAATGRDLFKAKFSYASSCNVCAAGTRHNYSLDLYIMPLDGSINLKEKAHKGLFLSTSSSEKSAVSTGGHGVMDLRNSETIGRIIPGPTGSLTVKDGSSSLAFRVAVPINAGYGGRASEMLIEDGATTAQVGRIVKQWGKSDNDWNIICCCAPGRDHGLFTLDMAAVSNVKKRALLVMVSILADAVAFDFRAAGPVSHKSIERADDSPVRPKTEEKTSLLAANPINN